MVDDPTGQGTKPADNLSIQVTGLEPAPTPEGEIGQALILNTTRGDIPCLLHDSEPMTDRAVLWVGGAAGGFGGPAGGINRDLSQELRAEGISSLRLHYRMPNTFPECVLDTLAGVTLLEGLGVERVALVGHSFGGAVVIAAAPVSDTVAAVCALSSQTYGATNVALVSPRPLLLGHGKADTRLGPHCSEFIYEWAREPKKLVLFEGAGHGLRECRDELHDLLKEWFLRVLPQAE